MSECAGHQRIVVAYIFRGSRRDYLACVACDFANLWPNFSRTAPVKE